MAYTTEANKKGISNKELLLDSRRLLGEGVFNKKRLTLILAVIIFSLCTSVLESSDKGYSFYYSFPITVGNEILNIKLSIGFGILTLLFGGFLSYGMALLFLRNTRGAERIDLADIFSGFKSFKEIFALGLLYNLFIRLWTMLFIIPGIVKSFSYSMAYYIKIDKPALSAKECITESRRVMDGHKGELFLLELRILFFPVLLFFISAFATVASSFNMIVSMGYYGEQINTTPILIGAIIFVVAIILLLFGALWLLYVTPHLYSAEALFYERLFSEQFRTPEKAEASSTDNAVAEENGSSNVGDNPDGNGGSNDISTESI